MCFPPVVMASQGRKKSLAAMLHLSMWYPLNPSSIYPIPWAIIQLLIWQIPLLQTPWIISWIKWCIKSIFRMKNRPFIEVSTKIRKMSWHNKTLSVLVFLNKIDSGSNSWPCLSVFTIMFWLLVPLLWCWYLESLWSFEKRKPGSLVAAKQAQALLSYPSEAVEPRSLIFDILSFPAWFLLAAAFDRNL